MIIKNPAAFNPQFERRFAALTTGMMEWWNIGIMDLEDWENQSIAGA
jgi:hypothetical protein